MRGTLRGVRSRVERLVADVQRRSAGPDWEDLIARLQAARRRPATKRPAKTLEEVRVESRVLRAKLREAGYL